MSLQIFLTSGPAFLVSFVKPLLMFVTFLPWAWLISSKLDKDARVHHLNAHMFNGIHLACGLGALAAMLVIPLFFVGWPVGIVILAAPIYVYWQIRDRSVPEDLRFSISGAGFTSKLATRKQSRAARGAVIKFLDSKGVEHDVPVKEDPRFTSHLLAEDVIGPALRPGPPKSIWWSPVAVRPSPRPSTGSASSASKARPTPQCPWSTTSRAWQVWTSTTAGGGRARRSS